METAVAFMTQRRPAGGQMASFPASTKEFFEKRSRNDQLIVRARVLLSGFWRLCMTVIEGEPTQLSAPFPDLRHRLLAAAPCSLAYTRAGARSPVTNHGWPAHSSRHGARPVHDRTIEVGRSGPRGTAGAVRTNRRSACRLRADRRRESHRRRGPALDREAATPHRTNGGSRGGIQGGASRASRGRGRQRRPRRGAHEGECLEGGARSSARGGTARGRELRPVRRPRPRLPARRGRPSLPRVLPAGDGARPWRSGPGRRVRSHDARVRLIDRGRRIRRGRGERRTVRLGDRVHPSPAAAGGRGHRARAAAEWVLGQARRRRRHLGSQSLDQPGHSRRGRRGQHLAAERGCDGGGQALPRTVRDWRHRPSSVVLRRRNHRHITAAGVGHGRALAARHALHLLPVVVPRHRRVLR